MRIPQQLEPHSFCGTSGTAFEAAEKVGMAGVPPAEAGSGQENKSLIGTTEVVP
jgi:hypothetical protein